MCSPYLDVSETGRFSKLGSTFPEYNVIKAGNSVMFSICSSVITNKPDISSLSDALPLDRWWSIRCELTSSLQLFKATKSVNPLKIKLKKEKYHSWRQPFLSTDSTKFFSGFLFITANVVSITAVIFFLSNSYFRSSNVWYSYIPLPFTGLKRTDQMTSFQMDC